MICSRRRNSLRVTHRRSSLSSDGDQTALSSDGTFTGNPVCVTGRSPYRFRSCFEPVSPETRCVCLEHSNSNRRSVGESVTHSDGASVVIELEFVAAVPTLGFLSEEAIRVAFRADAGSGRDGCGDRRLALRATDLHTRLTCTGHGRERSRRSPIVIGTVRGHESSFQIVRSGTIGFTRWNGQRYRAVVALTLEVRPYRSRVRTRRTPFRSRRAGPPAAGCRP